MTTQDERFIARDRMRFIKNTQSSSLCYLGILFDVFYFVNLFKSDVGSYYYTIQIGIAIVYNLIFLLVAFLASEGVKNYKKSYSYILFVVGALQFARIFYIPAKAHGATTLINNVETTVMGNGQFTTIVVYLCISGICLLLAGWINLKKCNALEEHMKSIEGQVA